MEYLNHIEKLECVKKGDKSSFDGEGERNNYIHEFDWKTNIWNRFDLPSWLDEYINDTYVGNWIQNLETNEWALISYFNKKIKKFIYNMRIISIPRKLDAKYYGYERSLHRKLCIHMIKFIKNGYH